MDKDSRDEKLAGNRTTCHPPSASMVSFACECSLFVFKRYCNFIIMFEKYLFIGYNYKLYIDESKISISVFISITLGTD